MLSQEHFRACWKVLNSMLTANNGVYALPFLEPVSKSQVPGYYDVIKHPMDVSKIKSKLADKPSKSKYESVHAFKKDLELMLSNALTFNKADRDNPALTVYGCAKHLKSHLAKSWKTIVKPLLKQTAEEATEAHPSSAAPPPAPFDAAACQKILSTLARMPEAKGFYHEPMWEELYVELIEEPLALENVERMLERGTINSLQVFLDKVRTVFANCLSYFVEPVAHKKLRVPALTCLSAFNDMVWKDLPEALALRPKPGVTRAEWKKCCKVMESVLNREGKMLFVRSPDKYGVALPKYDTIIKEPMHLGLVQQKLHLDRYKTVKEFGLDMTKVFQNCITYNTEMGGNGEIIQVAKDLLSHFEKRYKDKIGGDLKQKKPKTGSIKAPKTHKEVGQSKGLSNQPQLRAMCKKILKKLMKSENCMYFLEPVDWKALNLPHYPTIIKHPMDLGTIKTKLERGEYGSVDDFAYDVRLVFKNCLKFNQEETKEFPIRTWAKAASDSFEQMYQQDLMPLVHPEETPPLVVPAPPKEEGQVEPSRVLPIKVKTTKKSPKNKAKGSPSSSAAFPQETDYKKLVERLMKDERALSFNAPFDYAAAGLLDYPKVVKKPMDFLTIKKKLTSHQYASADAFVEDMELVFSNCLLYNKDQSPEFPIRTWCEELRTKFRQMLDKLRKKHAEKEERRHQKDADGSGGKAKRSALPKATLIKVLEELSNLPACKDFRTPVPWKELGLDDYLDIVKQPMDLQTVRRKLNGNKYASSEEFAEDVRLMFNNCLLYNREESPEYPIRTWAKELLEFFETTLKTALDEVREKAEKEAEKARQKAIKKKSKPKPEPSPVKVKAPAVEPPPLAPEPKPAEEEEDLPPPPPPPPPAQPQSQPKLSPIPTIKIPVEAPIDPTPPPPSAAYPSVVKMKRKRVEDGEAELNERRRLKKEKKAKAKVKSKAKKTSPLGRDRGVVEGGEVWEGAEEWELCMRKVLDKFRKNEWALFYFDKPVLELFTDKAFHDSYLSIVSEPMDLRTIYKKLSKHRYATAEETLRDMELIFKNAEVFNSDPTDPVACNTRDAAGHLRQHWLNLFHESPIGDKAERDKLRKARDVVVSARPLKSANVMRVLKKLMSPSRAKVSQYFMELYDWERFNKRDYPLIVKRPMALSIVKSNVNSNRIKTLGEFAADVRLIFANCLLYNKDVPENKFIRDCAKSLSDVFEDAWGDLTVDVVEKIGRKEIKAKYEEPKASPPPAAPPEEEIELTDDDDQDYVEPSKPSLKQNHAPFSRSVSTESLDLDAKPVSVGSILSGSNAPAASSHARLPSVSPHAKRGREELSSDTKQSLEKAFLEGAAVAARQALKRSKRLKEERLMNAKQAERRRKRELQQEQAQGVTAEELSSVALNLAGKGRRRKRARPLNLADAEENKSRNVRAEIKWKQKAEQFFETQRNVLVGSLQKSNMNASSGYPVEIITISATLDRNGAGTEEEASSSERSVFCVWERIKVGQTQFILGRLYIRKTGALELGLAEGFYCKSAKIDAGRETLKVEIQGRGRAPLEARAITEICLGHIDSKASRLASLSLPFKYVARVNRMRDFLQERSWITSHAPGTHLLYSVTDNSESNSKVLLHERDTTMRFLGVSGNFSLGFCGEVVEF